MTKELRIGDTFEQLSYQLKGQKIEWPSVAQELQLEAKNATVPHGLYCLVASDGTLGRIVPILSSGRASSEEAYVVEITDLDAVYRIARSAVRDDVWFEVTQALCRIGEILGDESLASQPQAQEAKAVADTALGMADSFQTEYPSLWRVVSELPDEGGNHTYYVLAHGFEELVDYVLRPEPDSAPTKIVAVEFVADGVHDTSVYLDDALAARRDELARADLRRRIEALDVSPKARNALLRGMGVDPETGEMKDDKPFHFRRAFTDSAGHCLSFDKWARAVVRGDSRIRTELLCVRRFGEKYLTELEQALRRAGYGEVGQ